MFNSVDPRRKSAAIIRFLSSLYLGYSGDQGGHEPLQVNGGGFFNGQVTVGGVLKALSTFLFAGTSITATLGTGSMVLAPGFLGPTGSGNLAVGTPINTSAASGGTSATIPLPAGSSIVVIHQSGNNGSGSVLCIADNQGGFCAITPVGSAASSGSTNISTINAVSNGFTITCLATGTTTNFSGSVISTG